MREPRVAITTENVADYFDGVMIEVRDFPSGTHGVPGWKCKACGWTVGTVGLPPPHDCPRPTDSQHKGRE